MAPQSRGYTGCRPYQPEEAIVLPEPGEKLMHQTETTTAGATELRISQTIALCKLAGISWTPKTPAGSDYLGPDECFTGPISMEQMMTLLNACGTFSASADELIAGQRAALDSHCATREQIIEVLHAAADGPSRIAATDKVLALLCAQPAPALPATTAPQVTQALDQLETYFNRESVGFAQCQVLREAIAVGTTRVQVHNSALEAAMAISKASRSWADVDAMRALKRPASDASSAGSPDEGIVALAAARWNAVLGSAYLCPHGNAGVSSPMPNNYAHLGLELWTRLDEDYDASSENARAIDWLTKYADIARAAQAEPKSDAPTLTFVA